jgi:RNA polymerase sigma factor (sigma-70 family)
LTEVPQPANSGAGLTAAGLLITKWGVICCCAVTVADAKPSLVERLFAEQGSALLGFLRRRIRTKADAPDLAQEVYLRMLRVSDQEAIRSPLHYLYTVANNLVKEHASLERRQASSIEITDALADEQLVALPALDGDLDVAQRLARLQLVLNHLRPQCRAAVALRFMHGMPYPGIAKRLGVSPSMARKYVTQGIDECRRRMARLGVNP